MIEMTPEEEKLFAELKKRGVHVSPDLLKEQSDFDASAGTTSVQPTSDDNHVQPRIDYAGGITSGRGNPSERSGGSRIPPPIAGLQLPMPGQVTGSNEPGSTIHQLPPVTAQYPGQIIAVPKSLVPSESTDQEPDEQASIGSPRTPSGKNANDPKVLAKALAQQIKTPISSQERSWIDPSKSSPFKSPLQQEVPKSHQTAGTTLQSPIVTPQTQTSRYPGDFNKPTPLQPKANASDSDGVLKPGDFPANFLDAGVRKQKVVSQIVREDAGE
jgi:hypothetical protein